MSPDAAAGMPASLLVGPLLRYVDERCAVIWVETDRPCRVEVLGAHADTWAVHDHHYALVRVEDLEPGTVTPYEVTLDGMTAWPDPQSPFPPSVIRTAASSTVPFRLAFGSCRRSAPLDGEHLDSLGADALAALAERIAQGAAEPLHALLLLGDQVYADDPSAAIAERIHARHPGEDSPVAGEVHDFEEYTWLYHEAWTASAVRWLLSTVPSCMLLDDHDLRDDWNTSRSWRRQMASEPWWRDRVVGALGSYWVYQHLGTLGPQQLDSDEMYQRVQSISDDEERTRLLDEFAWRADVESSARRWSFCRDLGGPARRVRLIAVDSRCSRHLDPDDRRMVDADEWDWVTDRTVEMPDRIDHLVVASTLPWLLPPGIHHLEGWNEAVSSGAWGRLFQRFGEWLRQYLDLEHWAAFRDSLTETTDLLEQVVGSDDPPATVLLLSGDVHTSYVAEARLRNTPYARTRIHQLTMSPFRNDIERVAKRADQLCARPRVGRLLARLARSANVRDVPMDWEIGHGPWFDNGVMTIEFDDRGARVRVEHATVDGDTQVITTTADVELSSPPGVAPGVAAG